MDDFLYFIGRIFTKLFSRISDCGWDCDITELGWIEYILLFSIFILTFALTRKVLTRNKDQTDETI